MGTRNLINLLAFTLWACLYFAYIIQGTEISLKVEEAKTNMQSVSSTSTQYTEYRQDYEDYLEEFYRLIQISNWIGIVVYFFPLRIIVEYLFTVKTRRHFSMFSISHSNFIDVALCIIITIRLEREYSVYRTGLSDLESGSFELHETYYNNIYVKEQDDDFLSYMYAVTVMLVGIKGFYLVRYTRIFGPLIKMILLMIRDFLIFFLLLFLNILIFYFIGFLLFKDVDEYSTGFNTI